MCTQTQVSWSPEALDSPGAGVPGNGEGGSTLWALGTELGCSVIAASLGFKFFNNLNNKIGLHVKMITMPFQDNTPPPSLQTNDEA